MNKAMRVIQRPYGRRKNGGWVIRTESLKQALKDADVMELGNVQVGARQLKQLVSLMAKEDGHVMVSSNGCLEVKNVAIAFMPQSEGHRRGQFRKPRLEHSFRIANKAWLPDKPKVITVIKPKKYG